MRHSFILVMMGAALAAGCSKNSGSGNVTAPTPQPFRLSSVTIDGRTPSSLTYDVSVSATIRLAFTAAIDHASAANTISLTDNTGAPVALAPSFANGDSTVVIQPSAPLKHFSAYILQAPTSLRSQGGANLSASDTLHFITSLDSTDKFPRVSDSALLTLVQQQTFKYFWDFGHPVSGLSRERTSSGDLVTTGGSGFGIMAILVGIQRNFITRSQGLGRLTTIVDFLSDSTRVSRYHGAFPHWLNGSTGATIPFSTNDDGGDIVETSYMLEGLLCARQYFNSTTDAQEIALRTAINSIWNAVDFNWYRQNGQNVLYWNWSPDHAWSVNVQVGGWCEALITYVLAASANQDSIPRIVYDNGWARNGGMVNGKSFYGITLPLGPDQGGPLFFAHYSFLGIDPAGLSDAYANYWTQDTAHTRINYLYCANNPKHYFGYSYLCWGLTASDEQNGYSAHSPTNDDGVISPTAAISSLPYLPTESMNTLRFFYYTLGDKLWKQYGFIDAFNLSTGWYDTDFLAIDQGPQIVMIENYRSGLLWNLFMSCPEIKAGMKKLGFQGPSL